jgi:hypothetical protein
LLRGRAGWSALVIASLPITASPLLVPSEQRLLRFLAAVAAVMLVAKLYDVQYDVRCSRSPTLRDFVSFVLHPFSLVRRCLIHESRMSRRRILFALAKGVLGFSAGSALLYWLFCIRWEGCPFLVEHASKVAAFYAAILGGLSAATAIWRLFGGQARDYMDKPFAAHTPADFWRRYNRPVQQFLWLDVFKPLGGRRAPIRTILLVFVVSAAIHEYVFGIAIGRVQGFQAAFFLVHAVAAAATARIKPKGWNAALWIVGTLVFNLISSVLFFASINGLVPFYSRGLPTWLHCW